jgi:hypothetical protein
MLRHLSGLTVYVRNCEVYESWLIIIMLMVRQHIAHDNAEFILYPFRYSGPMIQLWHQLLVGNFS